MPRAEGTVDRIRVRTGGVIGLTAPVPLRAAIGCAAAHPLALALCLPALLLLACGCRPLDRPPVPPDPPAVTVTAYLARSCPASQKTVLQLETLSAEYPGAVTVQIIDTDDAEGVRRREEAGLDCSALVINEATTLAWGDGEARRTVSFLYPPGLSWTAEDLRAAVEAGLAGDLTPAPPEEARAVRLIAARVRAQAVRMGPDGAETGQLVINDRIVLEVTEPAGDLDPGQRVALAADALATLLERPFSPDQLRVEAAEDGMVLSAGEERLLAITDADARAQELGVEQLANTWRRAVRDALVRAALRES